MATARLTELKKGTSNMATIKVYNSSECLVWEGSENEFYELRKQNLLNDSDRIVVEEK